MTQRSGLTHMFDPYSIMLAASPHCYYLFCTMIQQESQHFRRHYSHRTVPSGVVALQILQFTRDYILNVAVVWTKQNYPNKINNKI